jgi:hypothetical protein
MVSSIRSTAVLSLFLAAVAFLPSEAFAACRVEDSAFLQSFRNNPNEDLNDYARILADADSSDRRCVELASYALINKVNATPTYIWNQWLQGSLAGVAFAAANRIGANGFATQQLDQALKRIHDNFTTIGRDTTCAKVSLNQCVDDFMVGAPGFAWMAAYYHRRGNPHGTVSTFQTKALNGINDGFNEVCIRRNNPLPGEPFCNGTAADLEPVNGGTWSFNHGQRMPSYGYGLITSMSNAYLGLQASGYTGTIFSANQQKIARGLAREMQTYTNGTEFSYDCETSLEPDANGNWGFAYCGGPDNYSAKMYWLKDAYTSYFGGMPAGTYQGDGTSFAASKFNLNPWDGGFFSWNRYMYYYWMTHEWVSSPRQFLPFDAANPIGYVDFVDAGGVMHGWTCDTDASYGSNRVDVYSNGNFVAYGYATVGSEAAVNSLCGGGTAHRFLVQLPLSARGTTLTTYGLDYTWYGFTQLPCSTGNCNYN